MRERLTAFSFVSFLSIVLTFCSLAFATSSRLSGMGDLSIVIEDESNMINLWDFAGNPAAFLEDEKGSSIRGELIWNPYRMRKLPFFDRRIIAGGTSDALGESFDNFVSVSLRKAGDYALGLGGNYFHRETDFDTAHTGFDDPRHKLTYPNASLVFSKGLGSVASVGVSFRYLDHRFRFARHFRNLPNSFGTYRYEWTEEEMEGFRAQMGFLRRLAGGSVLGVAVGYERLKINWAYTLAGYYCPRYWEPGLFYSPPFVQPVDDGTHELGWVSGQVLLKPRPDLSLVTECMLQFLEDEDNFDEPDNRLYVRFRGIYDASATLRLGLLFSGASSYTEYYDPVLSYFTSIRHRTSTIQWGAGLAFRLGRDAVAGVEYHFTRSPKPCQYSESWDLKAHSLNIGIEGRISEDVLLRAGYIRSLTDRELEDQEQNGDMRGNTYTLGWGIQPPGASLIFEFSYRYVSNDYADWYGNWDVESRADIFSASLKKMF